MNSYELLFMPYTTIKTYIYLQRLNINKKKCVFQNRKIINDINLPYHNLVWTKRTDTPLVYIKYRVCQVIENLLNKIFKAKKNLYTCLTKKKGRLFNKTGLKLKDDLNEASELTACPDPVSLIHVGY